MSNAGLAIFSCLYYIVLGIRHYGPRLEKAKSYMGGGVHDALRVLVILGVFAPQELDRP